MVDLMNSQVMTLSQSLKLGRHVAVTKALREGILKVGAKRASKLDNETEHDQWFSSIGEAPNAELFRLYSKVTGRNIPISECSY